MALSRVLNDNNQRSWQFIWLDQLTNFTPDEVIMNQTSLYSVTNYLKTFRNAEDLRAYLRNISPDNHVVLIAQSQLYYDILPFVEESKIISSVYLYSVEYDDKSFTAIESQSKLKLITKTFEEARDNLKRDYSCERQRMYQNMDEAITISVFNTELTCDRSSTGINGQFTLLHILFDLLIRIPYCPNDFSALVEIFTDEYKSNSINLAILHEFKETYSPQQALLWYTKESFIYRRLNQALRVQNIDLLFLFRFFIYDIYQQIQEYKCSEPIRIYRGQLMSEDELNTLINSVGQLISMHSFFSTTTNCSLALFYLGDTPPSDCLKKVLFEINADPRIDGAMPFANVSSVSQFPSEEEILIMLGSIFRVEAAESQYEHNGNHIYIFRMYLYSNQDANFRHVYEALKTEIGIDTTERVTLLHFGNALVEMGKFHEGEKYLLKFYNDISDDHPDAAQCYQLLGEASLGNGEFDVSSQRLHKALDLRLHTLSADHVTVGESYNIIGILYRHKREYGLALESYTKALNIWEKNIQENYVRVSCCLNNMGVTYEKLGKHQESLDCLQEAYSLCEKHLPVDHPYLAATIHNIGDVHSSFAQFDLALVYYQRALSMFQKFLPYVHRNIAYTLTSIGLIFEKKRETEKSLLYLEKSMDIYKKILPVTHEDRIRTDTSIRRIKDCIQS